MYSSHTHELKWTFPVSQQQYPTRHKGVTNKSPVTGTGQSFWSCPVSFPEALHPKLQTISIVLGYPPGLDGKNLFLKTL